MKDVRAPGSLIVRAITVEDFDALTDFYADNAKLVVKQGEMVMFEGADTALVVTEFFVDAVDRNGVDASTVRRETYVFRRLAARKWLYAIDNSYGTGLLDAP